MSYQVTTSTVESQLIAAVRCSVVVGEVGRVWGSALDLVWAFLRSHPEIQRGHNFFLYYHPARRGEPMDVYFGVQAMERFEGEGEVICADTPAGEVVMTTHVGGYDQLSGAHNAIHAWCASSGREFGGSSWEIYGDWNDDPTKVETQVVYLLSDKVACR